MILGLTTGCGNKKEDGGQQNSLNQSSSENGGLIKVVYYNPTTGSECTESDFNTNLQNHINGGHETVTGLKEDCMKWYVYKDNGDTYDMILDHNTTERIEYNSTNNNYEPKEVLEALEIDTTNWQVTARLITGQEIADITGNTKWKDDGDDSSSEGSFYFDSNDSSQIATAKGESKYAWLFDYTFACTPYGCNVSDLNVNGYWTSTPRPSTSSNNVWAVYKKGNLTSYNANFGSIGIRPVITITK